MTAYVKTHREPAACGRFAFNRFKAAVQSGGQSQVESRGVESVSSHLQSEASSHEEEESSTPIRSRHEALLQAVKARVSENAPRRILRPAQSETTAQSSQFASGGFATCARDRYRDNPPRGIPLCR